MAEWKKKQKRLGKLERRNVELEQECEEERIILSELERGAKVEYEGPKEQIDRKRKEIEEVELQI